VSFFLVAPVVHAGDTGPAYLASGVASTGTVDEADDALVAYSGAEAKFATGKVGNIILRFTIPSTAETNGPRVWLTFKDSGNNDRFRAKLFSVDPTTGIETEIAAFDSNEGDPSSIVQRSTMLANQCAIDQTQMLLLEVTLNRTSGTTGETNPVFYGWGITSDSSGCA
jgi:hypothetical protein